jgi:AcrR family transcriptional regulator
MFAEQERVDMGTLAGQLSVSRATLYRWVGSREQLLEDVLEDLTLQFVTAALAECGGQGDERVLDFARRVMLSTFEFAPVRTFVAREPELALKLILGKTGAVHRRLTEGLATAAADQYPPRDIVAIEPLFDVIVQTCTALQWSTFAVGDEPPINDAITIIGLLLRAARSRPASAGI